MNNKLNAPKLWGNSRTVSDTSLPFLKYNVSSMNGGVTVTNVHSK
jgi:hypothetical protein